jgi:gamma-glutamyltranspeptidase/glutathione hydrolase
VRLMQAARIAVIVALVASPNHPRAADLSPGHWPANLRAELEDRELATFPASARVVEGAVLVTGTLSPTAVHAGIEALRQGGTAADAAATVELTQVATNLGSVVSYAGVSQLLYFEAKTGKVYALDAGWAGYRGEADPATIPAADVTFVVGQPAPEGKQGRKTLVPGFMAGVEAMHARFGRLPFKDLFQPAIWYARNGVTISPLLATYFLYQQQRLWRTPEGRRFASMADGSLPKAGDLFRQPDLALTLEHVAAEGAGYMYRGAWARAYVAAIRSDGGAITPNDMARYRAEWREPLSVGFNGVTVYGPGEDADHACPSLEALNLLTRLPVSTMGPYWTDPGAFTTYSRVLRFATLGRYLPQIAAAERARGIAGSCAARLTPAYADTFAPQIASLLSAPGAGADSGHHSDSVVVVDQWGNVAVLVHSINAVVWGDTGIVVGGIPIPDAASINKARLMSAKPGDRLGNDMAPLLALRDGRPVLAVATVGSSLHQENVRLVAGLLVQGLDLQTLLPAPPLLLDAGSFQPGQSLINTPVTVPTGGYDAKLLAALATAGTQVREVPPATVRALRGTAVVAVIDPSAHISRTAEVPDQVGFAEAR